MRSVFTNTWLSLLLVAGRVFAQEYVEPKVNYINPEGTSIPWLIGAGLIIGCLIVAFKPAKRSNLQ